ncbi:MAG: hypothetical protein ACREH4_07555, partial [Vitreimonas sp.]
MPKSRPRPRPKTAPRRDGDAGIIDRLVGLTAMVGEALDDGAPLVTFHEAGAELARVGLTDTLIDLFFAESGKRTRRVAVIDGCSALLTIALGELRLASSDGNANARTALREAADAVERQLGRTSLDAGALMQIVRAFALAELPPPEALKQAMARAVEEHGPQAEALTAASASPQAHFAALAADFDHDAFAIHTDMAASGAAFSPERRISMAAVMALSDEPAMRAAAIGFLLDADETVANSLAQFLADEGALKPSESIVIERIVRLRPWLAPSRQRFVDKALTALRKTALAPVAPPPRTALR